MALLKIGSFNVRCPDDPPPNDWDTRKYRLYETLREIKYDIVGTQEAFPNYVSDINEAMGYCSAGHGREADKSGEGVPIFYDPERLSLISSETIWLTSTPEVYSLDFGTPVPRIATIGHFSDKQSAGEFVFINVHLQHRQMYETQKKQLETAISRVKEKYPQLPVILVGDFNAFPERLAPRYAAELFKDAREVSETQPSGPDGETYHGYKLDRSERLYQERIDYIFVSDEFKVKSFAVIDNFDADGLASSDHYPLAAEVELT